MSNSKISQVSTRSISKQGITQKSIRRKDFVVSGEFLTGKSDLSLDFNDSFNNKDSFTLQELGNKELNFLASLNDLDVSLIPNDSKSESILKASGLEEGRNQYKNDDTYIRSKPLLLENSQVINKWWCHGCTLADDGAHSGCNLQ